MFCDLNAVIGILGVYLQRVIKWIRPVFFGACVSTRY
jgi:hypothetical protein